MHWATILYISLGAFLIIRELLVDDSERVELAPLPKRDSQGVYEYETN